MELYENKDISIMCPNCKRFLTKADSQDGRIHKLACRRCGKWIWFKPNDKKYRIIKNVPYRETSSGVRFY